MNDDPISVRPLLENDSEVNLNQSISRQPSNMSIAPPYPPARLQSPPLGYTAPPPMSRNRSFASSDGERQDDRQWGPGQRFNWVEATDRLYDRAIIVKSIYSIIVSTINSSISDISITRRKKATYLMLLATIPLLASHGLKYQAMSILDHTGVLGCDDELNWRSSHKLRNPLGHHAKS
jgi:hypothetical protein